MKYDSAAVVSRILRLVAVASILAFGLTARTATATYAQSPQPDTYPSLGSVDTPPTDPGAPPVGDTPPVDPTPTEPPPTDPPPTDPPTDPVGPLPTEAAPPTGAPPTDPPSVTAVPPPPDPGSVPAGVPPSDPPIAVEPPPPAPDTPPPSDPPLPDPTAVPIADPASIVDAQADSDPPAAEPIPPLPAAVTAPVAARSAARHSHSAPVTTPPRPAVVRQTRSIAVDPVVPAARHAEAPRSVVPGGLPHIGLTMPVGLEPMAAGIAAGLAVANRTPATVAVAIEFGRAGGGWAGAIVFNLWLGRQMRMRRMSQRQLAALSGVDHSTISRLLLHDRRPSLATATKLAKALRQVEGESDTADYFERVPEETLFPARRVEMALRADELLDDDEVMHVMSIYLDARRRRLAATRGGPVQVRQSTRAP